MTKQDFFAAHPNCDKAYQVGEDFFFESGLGSAHELATRRGLAMVEVTRSGKPAVSAAQQVAEDATLAEAAKVAAEADAASAEASAAAASAAAAIAEASAAEAKDAVAQMANTGGEGNVGGEGVGLDAKEAAQPDAPKGKKK
jgi:hypothetical protein